MNWKNLRLNPPTHNCRVVTSRKDVYGEYFGFKIYGWDAGRRELSYTRVTGYELVPYSFIPDDMHYIDLDEIK